MSSAQFPEKPERLRSGVYQIKNTANGKCYVGSSFAFGRRWNRHIRELRGNIHPNAKLQAAWNKYGPENFEFSVVECVEKDVILEREQFWIDSVDPEYNICKVAGNTSGVRPGADARLKMSMAKIGKTVSKEAREKISAYQKTKPVDWIAVAKSSESRRGGKRSPDARKRMSLAALGRTMSQAHKDAIAKSMREYRANRG